MTIENTENKTTLKICKITVSCDSWIVTQPNHSFDRVGWQAKIASIAIEFWIPRQIVHRSHFSLLSFRIGGILIVFLFALMKPKAKTFSSLVCTFSIKYKTIQN